MDGFRPSVISKNRQPEREDRSEVMRQISWSPSTPKPATQAVEVASTAAHERADVRPAIIFLGAALCFIIGFGLLGIGAHVPGILLLIAGIGLLLLPYHLNATEHHLGAVGILGSIIPRSRFRNLAQPLVRELTRPVGETNWEQLGHEGWGYKYG